MDSHKSHCKERNIDFYDDARIISVTLPPHIGHKTQPLDQTVFGLFKHFFNIAVDNWMTNNPGQTVFYYHVAEAAGWAYPKAFASSDIISGSNAQ